MSSLKSVCGNFESMFDNNKKYVFLYGDCRFDEGKNKLF